MQTALQIVDGHVAANGCTRCEVERRLGLGLHAMRSARKKGLRVLRVGRCDYVLGADLIKFAEQSNQAQDSSPQPYRSKASSKCQRLLANCRWTKRVRLPRMRSRKL